MSSRTRSVVAGATLLTLVLTAPFAFNLGGARAAPGWATQLAQIFLFAPLFVATGLAWRSQKPHGDELKPELFAWLAVLIVGLDGYATAYILVNLRLLPPYETFPPSAPDPTLLNPPWWAVTVIFGVMAFFGWYTFRRGGWGYYAGLLDIPYRRVTLLLILSGLVIAAWFLNSDSAAALLGVAAYLWIWIEPGERLWRKLLNVTLALAGAAPFAFFAQTAAANFPSSPTWWYLTLGAAYGLFPFLAVVLFLCGAALMLRFLRHGLRDA